jgi:hypothetical protein
VVLDTVGSEQAAIMAQLDAGPMAASMVPSRSDDKQFRRWFARFQRGDCAPPGPRRRYNERWPRSRLGDRRCAIALRDQLRGIEVRIRAGLHVGEVERRDDDVGGMAVPIAARVMAAAQPDEMLVSRAIRDLVVGSDIVLDDRGTRPLKGVEGDWQLSAVHRPGNPSNR